MSDTGAVARFYIGTTFGEFKFIQISPSYGMFVNPTTGTVGSYQQFPFESGTDFADIRVDDLLELLYTKPKGKIKFTPVSKTIAPKDRFVRVRRYYRPTVKDPHAANFGDIDPHRGLTFVFELDYYEYTVKFGYSVCKGDNFRKSMGLALAERDFEENPKLFVMKDSRISEEGVGHDLYYSKAFKLLDIEARRQFRNWITEQDEF